MCENFGALLHMTVHSLTKSAIFFAVGHACQKAGTQVMEDIRGLLKVSPTVGWGLLIGTFAILAIVVLNALSGPDRLTIGQTLIMPTSVGVTMTAPSNSNSCITVSSGSPVPGGTSP